MESNRPNILLVVTDQHRPDCLGSLGQVPVRTPSLDRLAREGTLFDRAYTPCPLCTPARASLLSGQYPSRHGAWSIGVDTPDDVLSLPRLLSQQAGYRTALIGKSHFKSCLANGSKEALPLSQDWDYFRQWTGPWFGFDYAKISVGHVHEPHAYSMHYGLFLNENGIEPDLPYFGRGGVPAFNVKENGRWALPEQLHPCHWVADETIDFLHAQKDAQQPFYACVNFSEPHPPFLVPEPYDSLYNEIELPPPNRRVESLEGKPTLYRSTLEQRVEELGWHERFRPMGQHSFGMMTTPERTPSEERFWRTYLGMITLLDFHLGRILDTLDELHLSDNTLVVFTSDHGDYMGDHWLWSKGGSHYDPVVRVPFLLRWPGRIPAGQRSSALQCLVDLPPTFLACAGLPPHPAMQGVNQEVCWLGREKQIRDGVWIEQWLERGASVNTWITQEHRLSLHSLRDENRDEVELYDLRNDPQESRNLAETEGSEHLVAQMLSQLIRHRDALHAPAQPRLGVA